MNNTGNLLDPRLDVVFNTLFLGRKTSLYNLVNAFLKKGDEDKTRGFEVRDLRSASERSCTKRTLHSSCTRVAVEAGFIANIRMVSVRDNFSRPKSLLMGLRMYDTQLEPSLYDGPKKKVLLISLLNFIERPEEEQIGSFELMRSSSASEDRNVELRYYELPKLQHGYPVSPNNRDLREWLDFFANAQSDRILLSQRISNPDILATLEDLLLLSESDQARQEAVDRECALQRDFISLKAADREHARHRDLLNNSTPLAQ